MAAIFVNVTTDFSQMAMGKRVQVSYTLVDVQSDP